MATPPTFQAEYEVADWTVSTTPRTVTPTTSAGDKLAIAAITADQLTQLTSPPTGNSLTYTLAQSITVASSCQVYGWTAPDDTGGTGWTLSVSETGTGAPPWGFTVARFSGSDGFGASAQTGPTSGAPSLDITTQADNSAIVVMVGDWAAIDGASRTWRTVNSITPTAANGFELVYARDAINYTVYVAYYPDAGAAGLKTVGLSAPTGQTFSIIAVEVKGAAGGAAPVPAQLIPKLPARLLLQLVAARQQAGQSEVAAGPSASGVASDTDRTSGNAAGIKGGTAATAGSTRTADQAAGVKGATTATGSMQRTSGTTAGTKASTGSGQGPQRGSGVSFGVKGGIGAAVDNQRSSGVAVKGVPPTGAGVGNLRIAGSTAGIKAITGVVVIGQLHSSGTNVVIHRGIGAITGQQHTASINTAVKAASAAISGQQRTRGLAEFSLAVVVIAYVEVSGASRASTIDARSINGTVEAISKISMIDAYSTGGSIEAVTVAAGQAS